MAIGTGVGASDPRRLVQAGSPIIAERSSPWGRWRVGARLFGPRGGAAL